MFFEEVIEVGDFGKTQRKSNFSVKKEFPPARFSAEIQSYYFDYHTIGSFKPLLLLICLRRVNESHLTYESQSNNSSGKRCRKIHQFL